MCLKDRMMRRISLVLILLTLGLSFNSCAKKKALKEKIPTAEKLAGKWDFQVNKRFQVSSNGDTTFTGYQLDKPGLETIEFTSNSTYILKRNLVPSYQESGTFSFVDKSFTDKGNKSVIFISTQPVSTAYEAEIELVDENELMLLQMDGNSGSGYVIFTEKRFVRIK